MSWYSAPIRWLRYAVEFLAATTGLWPFVEVLKGKRANPCPPLEDLAAMRVAAACERSCWERRPICLESA
jgi:hypothetical protein